MSRSTRDALIGCLCLFSSLIISGCGGGSSSTTTTVAAATNATGTGTAALGIPPAATGNTALVVLDTGPAAAITAAGGDINIPFVSVTVCPPGAAATDLACQTIDHVAVDTASSGLRLAQSALSASLNLPAVTVNGQALGECEQFADGYTWGSVRLADIYVGGEVARSVPIQDVGDHPGSASGVPADCSSSGPDESTVATLGANGLLGVGMFVNDCDQCLTAPPTPGTYYACSSTGCTNTIVTSTQVVQNPVALFAQDNNGVLLQLPAVSAAGAVNLQGSLIFGIGTQANNGLGAAVVYPADATGNFQTRYTPVGSGQSLSLAGFIDSGSNGIFFPDTGIVTCASGQYYCPATVLSLSATNSGTANTPTGTVNFTVVNFDNLATDIAAAPVGGPVGSPNSSFDWGLPFFFGRSVFTAISGASTPGGNGPYWAY